MDIKERKKLAKEITEICGFDRIRLFFYTKEISLETLIGIMYVDTNLPLLKNGDFPFRVRNEILKNSENYDTYYIERVKS